MTSPEEPSIEWRPRDTPLGSPAAPVSPPTGYAQTGSIPPQPYPAPPPPRRGMSGRAVLLLAAGIALTVLAIGGAVVAAAIVGGTLKPASTSSAGGGGVRVTGPDGKPWSPPPPPPTPAYRPVPQDFQLAVKEIEKHCFGSAGCNVTYRIDVTYVGTQALSTSKTYEVVYRVDGGEEPVLERFTVTGDTASVQQQEFIQTRSSKVVLRATVVDINEL